MAFQLTHSTSDNQGCTLHFWHQGRGLILVLISGGSGNGNMWDSIMSMLVKEYDVDTFDWRGNMRSALAKENQKPLNIPQ